MPYFLAPLWTTDPTELSEEEMWEHYERCLKAHDWMYMMSDDGGVYRAGEEQRNHIALLFEHLRLKDQPRTENLYNKHAPWLNEDGSRRDDW